jgi:hypothetical protein
MSKKNISEAKTLEQYRVTFENTESQPQIASTMAEYGYDSTKVAEGKALYETTRLAYDSNKRKINSPKSMQNTARKQKLFSVMTP